MPSRVPTTAARIAAVVVGMVVTLAVDLDAPYAHAAPAYGYTAPATPDVPAVSALMTSAIAARHLPGAVVMVGHGGQTALLRAYGVRKPAGEPNLDGVATPPSR